MGNVRGGKPDGKLPREDEDYLRRILATAPVGLVVVRGRVMEEMNDGFCLLSGYDRGELVGRSTRILFLGDDEFERVGRNLYGKGDEVTASVMEARLLRKDALIVDVLLRVAPFDDGVQDEGAYTVVVMDIGERKRAEHALESRLWALTSPETTAEDAVDGEAPLRLEALFDIEDLQKIQDAFSAATGVASIITDTQGRPITRPSNFTRLCSEVIRGTEIGLANCRRSDAMLGQVNDSVPRMRPCLSAGLWDGGAGISAGDRHIANWLIGQVVDESIDLAEVRAYAGKIGVDQAVFDEALAEVPIIPKERFANICEALFLIARQLSSLAYNNLQQARAIAERRKAAEEKDALYRELKHRVKNGMALISSLVDLESGRSESPEVHAALSSTKARIESLATLYDALGGAADPTEIRLDMYLAHIVEVVESAFDEAVAAMDFRCDFQPMTCQTRAAAPLALILMELLTNAIKYAFPSGEGGVVNLGVNLGAEKEIELTVEDDGVGLPVGFDPSASTGLGMELIRMLASQLNGRLSIGGGPGARFTVSLPPGSGHAADKYSKVSK